MTLLNDDEIEARLGTLDGWSRRDDEIVREFEFEDFVGSIGFVDKVVAPAEEMGHHPDLSISWNKVEVAIHDHHEGGLTEADFELAARIEKLGT
jgi:4a-hydroxytetrahydrobiopterin dehydratase